MEQVSVVIPTYNRAHLVPRAVASVLAALREGDELIVVDDGSTDGTRQALAPFGDRIRYLRTENGGAGAARNRGMRQAKHPLIAFLDSDDEWTPDALELRRAVMTAYRDLVFCFTDFAVRNEDGTEEHHYLAKWHNDTRDWEEILGPAVPFSTLAPLPAGREDFAVHRGGMYLRLLESLYVPAWTSLVRRDLAGADFFFPEDLKTCEDWACYGQIARRGPAAYLACETAWNHGHSGPRITRDSGMEGFYTARLQLSERIWGSDPEFMREHRDRYEQVIAAVHEARARWHLSRGHRRAARADLVAVDRPSYGLVVLSHLPGPVARRLGDARRAALRVAAALGVLQSWLESLIPFI